MRLRIKRRPNSKSWDYGYAMAEAPYPEFVFGDDEGGGKTFALGLDRAGEVRALVYLPPPKADMKEARQLAAARLVGYETAVTSLWLARFRLKRKKAGKSVEMPKVVEVKFAPFSKEGL